jgi:hypothetical protein
VDIERVARNVGAIYTAHGTALTYIPDLHRVVPSTRRNQVRVQGVVLDREDAVGVTGSGLESATALHLEDHRLGGLVVDTNRGILARRTVGVAHFVVVHCVHLITLVLHGVQALARGHMPVLDYARGVGRDEHILGTLRLGVGTKAECCGR